jgi:hypothetical protein
MHRAFISISFLVFLLFLNCKKQNVSSITGVEKEIFQIDQIDEPCIRNLENSPQIPPGMYYYGTKDLFTPDGKLLRIYNSEIFETQWGPIYDAPIIYLYDKENKVLATYNVFELVFEKSWGGNIDVTYNNEHNRFDMVFSLDAYGNYGTAYIDLNTNEFVRKLVAVPNDEKNEQILQHQGIPDGYLEGTNLKKNIK